MRPPILPPATRGPHTGRPRRGLSLIEVMVVLVLFSFGLLGLVGLQARALQVSVNAEDSSRAALLANELASAMWTNNTANLPASAISAWQARVANATAAGLPGGNGSVVVTGNVARITITWVPPGTSSGAENRYMTEVLIP